MALYAPAIRIEITGKVHLPIVIDQVTQTCPRGACIVVILRLVQNLVVKKAIAGACGCRKSRIQLLADGRTGESEVNRPGFIVVNSDSGPTAECIRRLAGNQVKGASLGISSKERSPAARAAPLHAPDPES